jgi:hypothetical protein
VQIKRNFRDQALPAGLVAFFVLILLAEVWSAGSPRGIDTWGHLFKAEYLAGQMRSQGIGAYFTAAWLPNWYMGDPYLTYYPPLTTLLLAPLIYIFSDSGAALRLLISFFLIGFSALTFMYLRRTWNSWAACLGTVLAVGAPYQMRTIFFEGNLPRMLSLLALPAIAILTDRLLIPRRRRALTMILLGLCWAWAILAHPQQAVIFVIGMGLYLVFRLVLDPEVPLPTSGLWLIAILLGALLAGPWLLLAYSHGELANIPFLPAEKIPLFSASLAGFLPLFDLTQGEVLFGFGAILLGLLAIGARPDPRRAAWYLAGLIAVWFSLGPDGVFFSLIPLNNQLLPERFLNFAAFGIPVAAAGLLPLGRNLRNIRVVLLVILVAVDLIPTASILPGVPYPQEQAVLEAVAAPQSGRVALLTYPEPTSLEVYFSGRNADLINGWALENTPNNEPIRRVLSAAEWGPDYLGALLSKWDVRTAVIAGGTDADPARAAVAAMGFSRSATLGRYEIWRQELPAAPVQEIPAQSMLVVGNDLSPFLAAFPFAEEASPADFAGSQHDRLAEYPVIGLYRFASNSASVQSFEEGITGYLNAGGNLVLDLSGMEDMFGQTLDMFGVHAYRMAFGDHIPMQWADPSADLPTDLPVSGLAEQNWSGATYDGLDTVLATVQQEGSSYPVLGYKNVGKGKVWFVGANLLYYAQLANNSEIRNYIRGKVLEGTPISTGLGLTAVPVRNYSETAEGLSFDYDVSAPISALVSYTYSPRWRATVDGIPVAVTVRDHLIRLSLPAGGHRVEIRNQPYGTIWPVLGLMAGILGVICCVAGVWTETRLRKTEPPKPDFLEVFQKTESPGGGTAFTPCAHCGFRLAESHPPTPITYPFQVSQCPICGARMDDEGFTEGKNLTREEQSRALNNWLRASGYDPRMIYTQWGFELEEFFKQ